METMPESKRHYGHDEGAWFWGCSACNPINDDEREVMHGKNRVDWVCPLCRKSQTSWHGTRLPRCGHCGQAEVALQRPEEFRSAIEEQTRAALIEAGVPADKTDELIELARELGRKLREHSGKE